MKNLSRVIKIILIVLVLLISAWFIISYIDVMWYQMDGGTPHMWNLFNIVIDLGESR